MKMATQKQGRRFVEVAREEGIPVEQVQRMICSPLLRFFLHFNFDEVEKWEDKFRKIGGLSSNSFILINRFQPLVYPDWVDKPLYPELEIKGPKRIDATQLEQWFHPEQKNGWVKGVVIHKHLKDNNLLPTCLGLHELLAIKARGLEFFRRYFQGKAVFGWKGVVRRRDGDLDVPCLVGDGGKVVLSWDWLGSDWDADDPALRLVK